jgi:ectoine hydroxylase-related dioxygenase (phytanoyl-CoA dioxygenase family)
MVPKRANSTNAWFAPWHIPTSSAWITILVIARRYRSGGRPRRLAAYDRRVALTRLHPETPINEVCNHLRSFGYAIVEDAIDGATLDRLEAESMPFIDDTPGGRDVYDGRHTRRTGQLIARCPTARGLVMHPLVVGTVRAFLDHVTAVQLHLTQIISIEPGETAQKLHRDQMAFDLFPFPPDYHVQCNTMWALTDFTAENGATNIAPGTSSMTDEEAALVPTEPAEMPRGSVLFYDGKVLHGGGANRSSGVRRGVNITYAVGWVRQEENQYLACPQDVARTLDDDLLKMMGYQEGAFALGYVGDQQDPLAVLRGERRPKQTIGEVARRSGGHQQFAEGLESESNRP